LDTSTNNTNILLQAGTGNIDLSGDTILLDAGTGTLTLSSEGTVTVGSGSLVFSNLTCNGYDNGGALTTDATGVVSCSNDDSGGGAGGFTDGGTYIYPTNSPRQFVFNNDGVRDTTGLFEVSGTDDIILRAGQAAAESAGTGDDFHLAAQDALAMYADDFTLTTSASDISSLLLRSTNGGIQLSTGSTPLGSIRLLSSGTLSLETSETNADILLLPGTGNVGIGTTGPGAKLHVETAGGGDDALSITYGGTQGLSVDGWGDLTFTGNATLYTTSNGNINFNPNGTGDVLVNYANLGVGTSSPGGILDVVGDEDIIMRAGLGASEFNLSGNNDLWLAAEDSLAMYADDFTLTTSASDINSLLLRSTNGGIQLSTGSTPLGSIRLLSSGTLSLETSETNADILLLPGTGNVGIGTTSPNFKVEVAGSSSVTLGSPQLLISGRGTNEYTTLGFGYVSNSSNPPAEIGYIETDVTNFTRGDLIFATRNVTTNTAATERVRIDSAGNVGIGTSSPAGILDVVGDSSIIMRAGLGANQDATTDGDDVQIAAEGALTLDGSGFTLTTSSGGWLLDLGHQRQQHQHLATIWVRKCRGWSNRPNFVAPCSIADCSISIRKRNSYYT
jgi:hypothetical protein